MPSPKEAALQMQLTNILMGCLGGAVVKNLLANAEDSGDGLDPWVGKIPWKRKWQPTPVFLPGKSHGQRILAGSSCGEVNLYLFDIFTKFFFGYVLGVHDCRLCAVK